MIVEVCFKIHQTFLFTQPILLNTKYVNILHAHAIECHFPWMLKFEDHDHDDNMRPLQTATGAERLLVPAQPPQPNLPRCHSLAATLGLTIVTTHQHDRVSAGVLALQYKYVLILPIFY